MQMLLAHYILDYNVETQFRSLFIMEQKEKFFTKLQVTDTVINLL